MSDALPHSRPWRDLHTAASGLSKRESSSRFLAIEYGYLGPVDEEPVMIEEYDFGHLHFCRCCTFEGVTTSASQAELERNRHASKC